jgi:beta-lactamase class A
MLMPCQLSRAERTLATAVFLLAAAPPLGAQGLAGLRGQLEQRIAASGAEVGLYFRDLTGPDSLAIDADLRFHAASTMKVPVMIQVFREVDAHRLRLNDRLPVINTFRSIADGSPYALDKADDSDSSLYGRVGQTLPVRDLVDLMITVSSNLATNILIDRVRTDSVRAALHDIGADSVTVLRGVEDGAAFRAGLNNTTTARGMGVVMAAIADGRAASAQSCGEMVRILRRQRFNKGIPAGLPRGASAAHKTGWLTGTHHDAAIVYWRDRPRYVLVVLTRGIQDEAQSAPLIAELTAMVHAHAVPESLR